MLRESVALAPKPRLVGFVACALVLFLLLLNHVGVWSQLVTPPLGPFLLSAAGLVVLASFCISLHSEPKPRPFWMGIAATFLSLIVWLLLIVHDPSQRPSSIAQLIMALCLALLMLSVFRASPLWYIGTAAITGLITIGVTGSYFYGTLSIIAIIGIWIVLNYGVQLFLDHEREICLVLEKRTRNKLIESRNAVILLLPVLFLAALGFYLHTKIQEGLLEAAYSNSAEVNGRQLVSRSCGTDPVNAARLERDIDCTIAEFQVQLVNRAVVVLSDSEIAISQNTNATPEEIARILQRMRPPTIEDQSACDGFQFGNKLVKITFRSPCRKLISEINKALTRTHTQITSQINTSITKGATDVNTIVAANSEEFKKSVSSEIDSTINDMRLTNKAIFRGVEVLEVTSIAVLVVSIIAALQMLMGRLLFDQQHSKRGLESPVMFQLGVGEAEDIKWEDDHVLDLSNGIQDKETWFVSLRLARRGPNTAMLATIPQAFSSMFQRIFSGNYVLTRIDVEGGENGPKISVAGDNKLVRVTVKERQQLCFRISDLVAFTSGVRLRSCYSTHIGGNLLRLGTFYSIAEGSGFLILKTEGIQLSNGQLGESTPASNLLIWDNAHAFALDQRIGFFKIWINEPSLVIKSSDGSAVLDEGESIKHPLWQRLWYLLRYLFLPI